MTIRAILLVTMAREFLKPTNKLNFVVPSRFETAHPGGPLPPCAAVQPRQPCAVPSRDHSAQWHWREGLRCPSPSWAGQGHSTQLPTGWDHFFAKVTAVNRYLVSNFYILQCLNLYLAKTMTHLSDLLLLISWFPFYFLPPLTDSLGYELQ